MRFGFHVSIAGGLSEVLERAKIRGCETLQLFSRNPRGWKYTVLDQEQVEIFRKDFAGEDIRPLFVHMPYLPNLATPTANLFAESVESLSEDLKRADALGMDFLVMHVGSRLDSDAETAMRKVAEGINRALSEVKNKIVLLLENTAGAGSEVGYSFEQIQEIIKRVDDQIRIGVALDIAHAFEAGYDFRAKESVDRTLKAFDEKIGLEKLQLLHLNDSKTDFNSRSDRHWHIGEGKIGIEGFRCIVNHPLLKHLPAIMETPRTDTKEDLRNMKVVRSLIK